MPPRRAGLSQARNEKNKVAMAVGRATMARTERIRGEKMTRRVRIKMNEQRYKESIRNVCKVLQHQTKCSRKLRGRSQLSLPHGTTNKKKQKNRRYETKNCCDISAGPKKQTPTVLTIFIRHEVA